MQKTSTAPQTLDKSIELPLVGSQLSIWLTDQVSQQRNVFNVAQYVEIKGEIDTAIFRKAIQYGLAEADTLHSHYIEKNSVAFQLIQPLPLPENINSIEILDLGKNQEVVLSAKNKALKIMQQDIAQKLDINGKEPLYHHKLIKINHDPKKPHWLWYQRYHHLMLDGFSFTAITRRIAAIYTAMMNRTSIGESPFTSFQPVVNEYLKYLDSKKYHVDKEFWFNYSKHLTKPLTLSKHTHSPIEQMNSQVFRHKLIIDSSLLSCIQKENSIVSSQENSAIISNELSSADIIMSVIFIYLAKMQTNSFGSNHTISEKSVGQSISQKWTQKVAVGFPFMRRMGSSALRSTGTVVNVLPLQLELANTDSLVDVAQKLSWEIRKLRKHQKYEAEQLQRDIGLVSNQQRLYGPTINCKIFDYKLDFAGHTGSTHQLATGPIDDMEFAIYIKSDQASIEISANMNRYTQSELELHADRILFLLEQMQERQIALQDIALISLQEKQKINQWSIGKKINSTYNEETTVLDVFDKQVEQQANNTALVFHQERLSFQQLSNKANQLCQILLKNKITKESIIAVALPRSINSIVSIIAILRTGATYLPLDLAHPDERLEMICEDAKPTLIITQKNISQRLPTTIETVQLDSEYYIEKCNNISNKATTLQVSIEGHQRAYIFYTSGSTGKPKGVMVPHDSLLNLMKALQVEIYSVALTQLNQSRLNVALTGSFSFDTSWDPILLMLLGNQLFLFEDEIKRDANALIKAISQHKIDMLAVAPSLATQLMQAGMMEPELSKEDKRYYPTLMNICGEPVSIALWQQLQKYPKLFAYNIYGPTEFTVYATYAKVTQNKSIPVIGKPLANTEVYVLNENLQTVPVGVQGELYLAGKNMTSGYLNRPVTTASRFVANPFRKGEVMYLTGDIVRWNTQGDLEFIGRSDNQVKVRGFRIELGEVENALSSLSSVHEAAVIVEATENGNRLLGYCTLKKFLVENEQTIISQLLDELSLSLPAYMLPSVITLLEKFPLTVSGKIDKQSLPKPKFQTNKNSRPAKTKIEKLLCNSIVSVLDLSNKDNTQVGMQDDFFSLAGDSITAMQLSTQLRQAGFSLTPRDIFSQRTPEKMLAFLKPISTNDNNSDTKNNSPLNIPNNIQQSVITSPELLEKYTSKVAILPTLPLQAGLLFHAALEGQGNNYSFTTRLDFQGEVDSERLRKSLNSILIKFPQLAAKFDVETTGEALQILPVDISDTKESSRLYWPWFEHDFSSLCDSEKISALNRLEMQEANYDFKKNSCILTRANLIRLDDNQYSLLITAHHLIIDGWSTPLLIQDLLTAYQDLSKPLKLTSTSYSKVIQELSARDLQPAKSAWRAYLNQATPTILFNENKNSEEVKELKLPIKKVLNDRIIQLSREQGLTLNTIIQGIWGALLSSMSGRNDVIFGSPVSGRFSDVNGIDEHIGLFSNTLPVRIQLTPEDSLINQLKKHQAQQIEMLEFDGLGLGEIQQFAGSDTLFDTLLVVENYPAPNTLFNQNFQGIKLEHVENRGYTHYPLTILVLPGDNPRILFEYRDSVTEPEKLAQRFIGLLEQFVEQPDISLAQLNLQTKEEKSFLKKINNTDKLLPQQTLCQLLAEQANKTPDKIALKDKKQILNYQQMRYQVEHLSQVLNSLSVATGDIVAVSLTRSNQLSIALQGVIDAGAAYLPLDNSYPDDRLAFMLQDAKPKILITSLMEQERFTKFKLSQQTTQLLFIEDLLAHQELTANNKFTKATVTTDDPAYIIYTSGSTGKPKGVIVSHGAIVNRLKWMQHEYPLTIKDVVLQKTPASFDVSVWEFFWPLVQGATLVMSPPDSHRDPEELSQLIEMHQVTTLHFVPSMLAAFVNHAKTRKSLSLINQYLKQVFCSGEALSKELTENYAQLFNAPLHNLYGPTEAAIDVTYYPATQFDREYKSSQGTGIPIGRPVWNTQLRVLDHFLREVGVGVSGELYLTGEQLAIGYYNRKALTADRFVADPYATADKTGQRMYRTGDIVRWLPTGDIEYLGRSDDQLKIRGQRIEVGEIEQAMLSLKHVSQAAVHARVINQNTQTLSSGDNRQLIGYVIPEIDNSKALLNQTDTPTLLQTLSEKLPAHMIPSTLVYVADFPLSANGKLDKKSLPDPESHNTSQGRTPKTGVESIIANTFSSLLGIETVNAEDSFFMLGGHSLLAMRLAAELRTKLSLPVSVGQIMVSPSVEELAAVLVDEKLRKDPEKAGFGHKLPIRQGQGVPLICINPGSGFSWQYTGFPKHLNSEYPIIGLQSPRPDGAVAVSKNMPEAIEHYFQLLRSVQPQGPYHFLGYSFGGTVAVALAARLESLGEEVAFVGLLDTYPPEGQEWKRPTEEEAQQEVEREKRQFMQAAQGEFADAASLAEQNKMFNDIVANYDDTVRLLATANTQAYSGKTHIFVAEKTLPEGWNVEESWAPFIKNLVQYRLPFAHDDIMSPDALNTLGPLLDATLNTLATLNLQKANTNF